MAAPKSKDYDLRAALTRELSRYEATFWNRFDSDSP